MNESLSVTGAWGPLPGRIVAIAATDDTLFLADVPRAGDPMRVHAGRWRDGLWRWETPWTVPRPPRLSQTHDLAESSAWIGVEARPDGIHVTLDRIEYQGGSHGIALATFANGAWTAVEEIESPTDSDIPFGAPALRRGAALLTSEDSDRLWHYTRAGTRWTGRPIALPSGCTISCGPPMDVDATGSEFVVAYDDAVKPSLAVYRLGSTGNYSLAETRVLPDWINTLAFGGSELYVGFRRPVADGATVWALRPDLPQPLVPVRRFVVPAPDDPKLEHLSELDVSADWVLVLQLDAAWVFDAAGSGPARNLELPVVGDGKLRRPMGVLMGSVAVVILEDRLGAFDLAGQHLAQ